MKINTHFSDKSPFVILSVLGIITAIMIMGLPKLETKNNYESDLPENDEIILQNRCFEEVFGKRDELIIVVCASDVLQPVTLQKICDITARVKEIPGVVPYETWSLSTIDHIGFYNGNIKAGPLMRGLPVNRTEIETLRYEIKDDYLINGRLVSNDFTHAIIVARLGEDYNQTTVVREAEKIISRQQGPEKIYLLGDPVIGEEVDRAIEGDIKKLFPLALILLFILFFLFFKTFTGVILPTGVIVISVIWTMGLAGHIGYPLTVVSSAIPVLLVAVASSYGIHVMHSYYYFLKQDSSKEIALLLAVKSIIKPVIIAGFTSAIGSLTLLTFRVTSIREFGVLAAAGIIFAMVLSLTLIPSVLKLRKENNKLVLVDKKEKELLFGKVLEKVRYIPFRYRKTVLFTSMLIVLVSAIGATRLHVGMDPVNYFPDDFPFSRNIRDFDEHFSGARKMYVMIEGASENVKSPNLLNKILFFQREAEKNKSVGGSLSFADVIKRTNLVLHENNHQFNKIPGTESEVAQAALLYSTVGEPDKYESIVSHDFMKTKITLDVRTSDVEAHAKLYRELKKKAENIFDSDVQVVFGGLMMIWIAQIWYIVIGKLLNISLSLILLMIIASVAFKSWKLGFFSILPVTLALTLNFGIMGFIGIRLNMATAIITAMGAGIGVDFAVHYLFRMRYNMEKGMEFREAINSTVDSSGKAIIVDMMSNILGFAVFIISPFEPVRQFGWLICLTMISSAAGALILLPACLSFYYREA